MSKFRAPIFLIVIAASVSLSGCTTLGRSFERPTISLSNVQLVQAGLLEQRYRLTLRVQNPNAIAIPVKGMTYAVKFAGAEFAQGATPESFTVPANGEDLVNIDVSTDLISTAQHVMNWLKSEPESLDYELSGKLQVNLPFARAIPFSKSGNVDFQGLRDRVSAPQL